MIEVRVRLFGAFRKYGDGREIAVELPERSGLGELKSALAVKLRARHAGFRDDGLLASSAFAGETAIFPPDVKFERSCSVAVLPPVCGG